jgi:pyruvate-ferredoxin/flavodoxin oxidoreductase
MQSLMDQYAVLTGRQYHLFDYYGFFFSFFFFFLKFSSFLLFVTIKIGAVDAEYVAVCMGSFAKTFEEFVLSCAEINSSVGMMLSSPPPKCGIISVHLFHPFSISHFIASIPTTCKHLTILDRAKEPGLFFLFK